MCKRKLLKLQQKLWMEDNVDKVLDGYTIKTFDSKKLTAH